MRATVLVLAAPELSSALAQALVAERASVRVASTAREVMDDLSRGHDEHAVAVIDLDLPGVDGPALASVLRGSEGARNLPIVFIGQDVSPGALAGVLDLGGIDALAKPLDVRLLVAKTEPLLRLHAQARELARAREGLERLRVANAALRANERRFRALADCMPQLVWTADTTGVMDYYSERACAYGGLPERAAEGRPWLEYVHPDDRAATSEAWTAALASGREYAHEHRVKMASGEYRWHLSRAILVHGEAGAPDRWFGTSTDIHAQKLAEHELRRAHALVELATQSTPVVAVVKDRDSRLVYGNAAAIRLIGRPAHELLGLNDVDCFGPELGGPILEHDRRVMQTGNTETFEETTPDGRVWLCTKTPWRDLDGEVVGVIAVAHDITYRKQAELLRQQNEARLAQALAQAEKAIAARDQVVSVVSHDLRNPLSTMRMQVALLRKALDGGASAAPASRERHLVRMERQITRMEKLLDELLDVASLQADQALTLDPRMTDLVALAREITDEHRETASRHHIELRAAIPSLMGAWDTDRIARVIHNLLSNAVKYSGPGSTVLVDLERVRSDGRDWAVLRVTDQGIGIPDKDRARIFHWFERGHNVSRTVKGSGLGLAGAREIVEQHGGAITFESREGQGSTFLVRLPMHATRADPARQDPPSGPLILS